MEYIGQVAYMAGVLPERQRARDYMTWLKQQRVGPVYIDLSGRKDASEVKVPRELTGMLKGGARAQRFLAIAAEMQPNESK